VTGAGSIAGSRSRAGTSSRSDTSSICCGSRAAFSRRRLQLGAVRWNRLQGRGGGRLRCAGHTPHPPARDWFALWLWCCSGVALVWLPAGFLSGLGALVAAGPLRPRAAAGEECGREGENRCPPLAFPTRARQTERERLLGACERGARVLSMDPYCGLCIHPEVARCVLSGDGHCGAGPLCRHR
jgi:hypothetical protein